MSVNVQGNAKQPLKQRIQELAASTDSKRQKLVNDVSHMALQAELFSRSRILDTSEAAVLIEQAIAYVTKVDGGKIKVCIAERLVVDAVMEYIRAVKPPGTHTDEYLASWQYSASSFGFIAEDRLAEAIYTYAHKEKESTERTTFLSKFDQVYRISATPSSETISLGLKGFVLDHNPGTVEVALTGDEDDGDEDAEEEDDGQEGVEDGGVGQWLHQVLRNDPRPTFLLPSVYAGPDVMFVLRKKSGTSVQRIICAVQVCSKFDRAALKANIYAHRSRKWP
jgi:hypothetical protein